MLLPQIRRLVPVLFLASLLFPGCAFPGSGAAGIPGRLRLELAGQGIRLWERAVTASTADRAPGHILRGRTNLTIQGPVTAEGIAAIAESMNRSRTRNLQLFRLDLSGAGIAASPLVLDIAALGSVVLPPGIAEIRIGNSGRTPFLLEAFFPPEGIETELLSVSGMLSAITVPSGVERIRVRSSQNLTVILAEGRENIDFDGAFQVISPNSAGTGNSRFTITLAMPSTLKEFSGSLPGCGTLYCYAESPPAASGSGSNCFPDLQTVYVPEGSEAAWEEAWFTYCPAKFRPLPRGKRTLEEFTRNYR